MFHAISTKAVAPPERFGFWLEALAGAAMPVRLRSDFADNFVATIEVATFATIATMNVTQPGTNLERTRTLIRRGDPETHNLVLNLRGNQRIVQERRDVVLGPGDMTVYSSSRPLWTHTSVRHGSERAIVLALPPGSLPLPPRRLDALLTTHFGRADGLSPLVSRYLYTLAGTRGV